MLKRIKIFQIVVVLIFSANQTWTAQAAPVASAHRFHTSLTRIDYDEKQKLFEISIQLFTHDLIPLLEQKTGANIDLGKTSAIDKTLLDYLNENFVLKDKNGTVKNLKWVGKESDVDTIWIYLETPSLEGLEGYNLQNTIFFESFPEQTNLVICRYENQKADLAFKAGDRIKEITVNKPTAEN